MVKYTSSSRKRTLHFFFLNEKNNNILLYVHKSMSSWRNKKTISLITPLITTAVFSLSIKTDKSEKTM